MNLLLALVAAVSLLLLGIVQSAAPAGQSGGKEEAAMPPMPPLPEELKQLERFTGTWDAEVEIMGEKSSGVETCRMDFGGLWLVSEFDGSFMGAPFKGLGLTGFDPAAGAFTGVWIDSSGPALSTIEHGAFAADGRTYTASARGVDFEGRPASYRHVTRFEGAGRRVFESFVAGADGGETPMMRIVYRRR